MAEPFALQPAEAAPTPAPVTPPRQWDAPRAPVLDLHADERFPLSVAVLKSEARATADAAIASGEAPELAWAREALRKVIGVGVEKVQIQPVPYPGEPFVFAEGDDRTVVQVRWFEASLPVFDILGWVGKADRLAAGARVVPYDRRRRAADLIPAARRRGWLA
jgi:hypothetical protein